MQRARLHLLRLLRSGVPEVEQGRGRSCHEPRGAHQAGLERPPQGKLRVTGQGDAEDRTRFSRFQPRFVAFPRVAATPEGSQLPPGLHPALEGDGDVQQFPSVRCDRSQSSGLGS